MRQKFFRFKGAFTLIELVVVIAILSLVVVTVSLRWSEPYQHAKFHAEIERILDFDFKARRFARIQNVQGKLEFDLDNHAVTSLRDAASLAPKIKLKCDSMKPITSIMTADQVISSGSFSLPVTTSGATPTYAIQFESSLGSKIVLIAGRTGQQINFEEKKDVEEVFRQLRLRGTDAR